MLHSYLQGFAIGLSLIVAIGAQNAFVLKQGLKKQAVFWVCFVCALSDSILVVLGITGFATVIQLYPELVGFAKWAGAVFLLWYGLQHAIQAFKSNQSLHAGSQNEIQLSKIIMVCLALTWLNPHVYLDTVVLIGSISTQFEQTKLYFTLGVITASWLFFFSLGYGARVLIPVFANPKAWKVLDVVIALIMWSIAISLIMTT
ncbi:amino acid transporter [Acinetobacter bohemicus]|uniref:L-lysine exporter family protein LysE/ArgO n=1 Tax=Acinetobacter bohemicus TaxID=1435036 RepID=A0A1I6U4J9_9GAMM|nr:LysE/ArgO family amino acid transporter [Acinetobacter bohemicus]KAB0652125.1 amino acid transporter [Acinetobacter bohemicus]SFS96439.1 L-lysine exporter family protein LysE/ArgO [Acinetobacter bohemicus]